MVRLNWQGEELTVRRLVVRSADGPGAAARAPAAAFGLATADDATDPRPGDFWIGCHPAGGWGDADPTRIGWVSGFEVPVALEALRRGVVGAEALPAVRRAAGPDVPVTVFGRG
jgi:hypothetical protein